MQRTEGTFVSTGRGTYRLGRQLGRGGMAEVFAARALGAAGFERPACVKLILPEVATDAEFRELFLREVRLAGDLCHSNLVQVFDCFEHGDQLGLVMELVDGMDLKKLIRRLTRLGRTLPPGLVAYVAGQMLLGLHAAHSRHVVHRDISPHNVLLSRQGEIKIADFGVAKAMVTHATRSGNLRGKLAYMSPEQARAKPIDHRTDLYSTGLVLYELLTGQRFVPKGGSQWNILADVVHATRPTIEGVEPQLARFVETLLSPEPDERHGSAEEALGALPSWDAVGPLGARELDRFVAELERADETTPDEPFDAVADTVPSPSPVSSPIDLVIPPTASMPELELDPGELDDLDAPTTVAPEGALLPETAAVPALDHSGEYTAVDATLRRGTRRWLLAALVFCALVLVLGAGLGAGALLRRLLHF